jgi:hypothetical protein
MRSADEWPYDSTLIAELDRLRARISESGGDYDGTTSVRDPDGKQWFRSQCWCGWRGEFYAHDVEAHDAWMEHHTVEQHR